MLEREHQISEEKRLRGEAKLALYHQRVQAMEAAKSARREALERCASFDSVVAAGAAVDTELFRCSLLLEPFFLGPAASHWFVCASVLACVCALVELLRSRWLGQLCVSGGGEEGDGVSRSRGWASCASRACHAPHLRTPQLWSKVRVLPPLCFYASTGHGARNCTRTGWQPRQHADHAPPCPPVIPQRYPRLKLATCLWLACDNQPTMA